MANEKRLIDANALSMNIFAVKCCLSPNSASEWTTGYRNGLEACLEQIYEQPTVDAVELVHGRWMLEAHEEYANYRWNVTAECSECHAEKREVYAEFITGFPKDWAEQIVLEHAESVKLHNYCPDCGAKMDGVRKLEWLVDIPNKPPGKGGICWF